MDGSPVPDAVAAPPPAALPPIGDMISAATTAALDNSGLLLGLWAASRLPLFALGAAAGLLRASATKPALVRFLRDVDWRVMSAFGAFVLVAIALGVVGYIASLVVMARALQGRPIGLGAALGAGFARAISVFAASILTLCAVLGGFVLLIFPGIYLSVRLSQSVNATVLEGIPAPGALARSWRLTQGRAWEVFVATLAFGLVALGAGIAVATGGVALRVAATAAGGPLAGAASGLLGDALRFLVSGWGAACALKLYFELTARVPA